MGQPATGQSKTSRTLYYMFLMTVTTCTNNREEAAASLNKRLTAVLSKGCGLHGRCPRTITCSTCITHSYSDIMHQKLFLFMRTDHVKLKIPNYFTHLFFLNSIFCGEKKKVSIIRSDISRLSCPKI